MTERVDLRPDLRAGVAGAIRQRHVGGAVDHRDPDPGDHQDGAAAAASRRGNTGGVRTWVTGPPRAGSPPRGVRILVVEPQSSCVGAGGSGLPVLLREERRPGCGAPPSAAFGPWMPCSRNTTPAICGLSRGAKKTNQPLSRRSFPLRAAAMRPAFEITCAVPVLPQTSCPSIRARPPVPPPLTTIHRPSRIAWSFSGVTSICDCGGGGGTGFQPSPSSTALQQMRRDAGSAVGERRACRPPSRPASPTPAPGRWRRKSSRRRTTSSLSCTLPSTPSRERAPGARSAGRCRSSRQGRGASPTCGFCRRRACCRRCRSTRRTTARSRAAGRRCRARASSSRRTSGRRTSRAPAQDTRKAGVMTPSSSPARPTAILNVEPGEYRPWSARFWSGFSSSVLSEAQVARSMPPAKAFGIVGRPAREAEHFAVCADRARQPRR